MSASPLAVVAAPAEAPTGATGPTGLTGPALHRALSDFSHRSLRELALRLTRTDEHRLFAIDPATRDD